MRDIRVALWVAIASALGSLASPAAFSYRCGTAVAVCSCAGTADCKDMRGSGLCKSDLDCSGGSDIDPVPIRTCKAARESANPGSGGSGNSGVKRPGNDNVAPPPTSAKPP